MKKHLAPSLHWRLWLVVALACGPIFGLSLLDYREQHRRAIAALQREAGMRLQDVARAEQAARRSMEQMFQIMARADNLRTLDQADCSGLAHRLRQSAPEFADLGAVRPDGQIFCSAQLSRTTLPLVADRQWFKDAIEQTGMGRGEFVVGRISGLQTMVYGFPVHDANGRLMAVLYASLPLQWFEAMIAQLRLPEGWTLFLLNGAGQLISYHPPERQPPQPSAEASAAFWQALRAGHKITEIQGLDGQRRMYALGTPSHILSPMLVALGAPIDRTVGELERRFWARMALLAVLTLASALLARFYIFKLIEGWIGRMGRAMAQLAQGRLQTRLGSLSPVTELAALEQGVNHMAEQLEQRTGEILRLSAAVEQSPVAMLMTDVRGCIVYTNPAFTTQTGYSSEEIRGQNPRVLHHGPRPEGAEDAMMAQLLEGKIWRGEFPNERKDGSAYLVRVVITPTRDSSNRVTHLTATMEDITAERQAQEHIEHLAYYDRLTDLGNRALLQKEMARALEASTAPGTPAGAPSHWALLLFDVVRFGQINETWGQAVGDAVLYEMAQRLSGSTPQGGTLSRLGSNTFAMLVPVQNPAHPPILAQSLQQILSEAYVMQGTQRLYVRVIAALAQAQRGEQAPEQLLKHAEMALNRARSSASPMALEFDASMQVAAQENALLEQGLRHALERGQLALYYQAQVDSEGRVIGAEALVRWLQGPGGKPVSPAQFIPLAEETGLIVPLGQWVLEQACAQLGRWQALAATAHLTLSINVSARQFHQSDFVDQVRQAIADSGVRPQGLKLELTESAALSGVDATVTRMHALRAQGLRFALDDFGTGYSSLSYLQRLPFDQLKIDQAFTRAMLADPASSAIVRAILVMCQALDLQVVAEGVETAEHHAFLRQHGCGYFQGYWFGKPLPIEAWQAQHAALAAAHS